MADKRDPLAFADIEGNMLQRLNLGKAFAETAEAAALKTVFLKERWCASNTGKVTQTSSALIYIFYSQ